MPPDEKAFEEAVSAYYEPLYRFALGLSRSEADASDLTQHAFEVFAEKSGALRDKTKTKTWLFTTVYRDYLQQKRHTTRFPHSEWDETMDTTIVELSRVEAAADAHSVMAALQALEEPFRSTLTLFYLHEHSYREIAGILDVPIGTVMSRLARGKEMLRAAVDSPRDNVARAQAVGKNLQP